MLEPVDNYELDKLNNVTSPNLSEIIWEGGKFEPSKCYIQNVTKWLSYDSPTGDNGTGDHELNMINKFCGDRLPLKMEAREKDTHLPYYIRNLVFSQYNNKFYLGPSTYYGLRFVIICFLKSLTMI